MVSGAFLLQILPHAGKETVSRERPAAAKESRLQLMGTGGLIKCLIRFDKHGLTWDCRGPGVIPTHTAKPT